MKAERRAKLTEDLTDVLADCHDDPGLFASEILRVRPKRWQRETLAEIRDQLAAGNHHLKVVARTCHGAGKTFLAAVIVLWWVGTRPGARCLTTAPGWASVANLLWPEINELYNGSLLRAIGLGRMLDTEWQIRDTWYAVGGASDKPTNLEGHHSKSAALRVVDEAKAVDDDVFDSTAGMLDAPETLDFWISTPSIEAGRFFERDTKTPGVIRAHVTVDDLIHDPESTPEQREAKEAWKRQCIADWGEDSETYAARCKAMYLQNAEGALFPGPWLARAAAATWEKVGRPQLGMDCAGSTDGDENAVVEKTGPDAQGRCVLELVGQPWRDRDTMVSKGRTLAFVRERRASVVRVDAIGIGKGVADALAMDAADDASTAHPWAVEEYRASAKAGEPDRFVNKKAEDAWAFRRSLEAGKERIIGPPRLFEQLRSMRYEILRDGRTRVIDPSKSPDLADALLIARSAGVVAGEVEAVPSARSAPRGQF